MVVVGSPSAQQQGMSTRKAPLASAILGVGWAIMGGILFMSTGKGNKEVAIRKTDVHDTFARFKPGAQKDASAAAAPGMEDGLAVLEAAANEDAV